MSAAIQGGRSTWTQMCRISICERCDGPVEQADYWRREARYVSATRRAHACVDRSYLHGGVRITWSRTCQVSPLLCLPLQRARQHTRQSMQGGESRGKGEKRYSDHLKWEELLNTYLLAVDAVWFTEINIACHPEKIQSQMNVKCRWNKSF